jgi:hypothetical protein
MFIKHFWNCYVSLEIPSISILQVLIIWIQTAFPATISYFFYQMLKPQRNLWFFNENAVLYATILSVALLAEASRKFLSVGLNFRPIEVISALIFSGTKLASARGATESTKKWLPGSERKGKKEPVVRFSHIVLYLFSPNFLKIITSSSIAPQPIPLSPTWIIS